MLGNVRDRARAGGHAMLMRADARRARIDVFEPEDAVRAQLTRAVKAAFDPLACSIPAGCRRASDAHEFLARAA